jgi:hypothetical protein
MTSYDVEYRYYLTDLLSNQVIAELPFTGVSYERVLRKAGGFSGSIPVIEATKKYDLYETTMPGRTGLYVLRNGQCVWGGIIWSRKYDESSKTLTVDASEFPSYFYHRFIWKTLAYGSAFIGISSFSIEDGVATITLEEDHDFSYGDFVKVTNTSPLVNGTFEIDDTPDSNVITYILNSDNPSENFITVSETQVTGAALRKLYDTYELVRDLIEKMNTDLSEYYGTFSDVYRGFGNELIEPGRTLQASVISKKVVDRTVTLRTAEDHLMVPGQDFDVYDVDSGLDDLNPWTVSEVPDSRTIVFNSEGLAEEIVETALAGVKTVFITRRKLEKTNDGDFATITTHVAHGATVGQRVAISGIDSPYNQKLDINFDGTYTIHSVTATTITYELASVIALPEEIIYGGLASVGSKIVYSTYGPYKSNSNLDFQFDNYNLSNKYQDTQVYRGYEAKSVGEILEDYSDNINGFEYRVDCDYDPFLGSFLRIFTLLDIENPNGSNEYPDIASSLLTDEQRIGYNKLVFEYPGSISSFTLQENAEDAATRFFVQGSVTDLTDEASQPYAVASDTELLNNKLGRSFPLVDAIEIINNTGDEDILYDYAQEYLYESKMPMGDIEISVNGSITPTVGSFYPGDWCTIIIDDPFILARLANDQEPRNDILVRKINSYKVSVPDNSFFPEAVTLELITDWKVDKTRQTFGLRATGGTN